MQLELSPRITLQIDDMYGEPNVEITILHTNERTGVIERRDLISPVPTDKLRDLADTLMAFANVTECQARYHGGE